jgi:hypothetical protein
MMDHPARKTRHARYPLIERLTRTVDGDMRSTIRLRNLSAPGTARAAIPDCSRLSTCVVRDRRILRQPIISDLRLCGDRSRHIVLDWTAQHGAVRP